MSKRVIRVISIEGNPDFVDKWLSARCPEVGHTQFVSNKMTIKELQRVVLGPDEFLTVCTMKYGEKDVTGL